MITFMNKEREGKKEGRESERRWEIGRKDRRKQAKKLFLGH